jgi:hypothetical protein
MTNLLPRGGPGIGEQAKISCTVVSELVIDLFEISARKHRKVMI